MPTVPAADTGAVPIPALAVDPDVDPVAPRVPDVLPDDAVAPRLLADRLERARAHLLRTLPVADLAILTDDLDRGVAAQVARPTGPVVGDTLPIATLSDHRDRPVRVAAPGRAAVVVLVRGVWCPFDNLTLAAYQRQVLPELREHDVDLVAISPQTPDAAESMVVAHDLRFPLLTDPGGAYARRLGLAHDLAPAVSAVHRRLGTDLTRLHAGGEWVLPHPATIVVNAAGVVRWAETHVDYTRRAEPARLLAAVRALG